MRAVWEGWRPPSRHPARRKRLAALVKRYVPSPAAGPVLVVEDDAPTRALLGRALSKAGWAVEDAENGRVALERIAWYCSLPERA